MQDYFPKVQADKFGTNYVTVVDDGYQQILENHQILQKPKKYVQRVSPNMDHPTPQYNRLPVMTNLYVGSLTVLGLLLVFRLIQKS